jgi:lysophospholipase L1-like esterase
MKLNLILTIFLLSGTIFVNGQIIKPKKHEYPIRIACIGNSITYGYGIKNREVNSYPAQLGKLLGENYRVENFGISGRTLLSLGDKPYIKEKAFSDAMTFRPNIVIIMLGTNDTKPRNWKHKDNFTEDYKNLVTAFDTLPSKPTIVLCQLVPAFPERWGINDSIIVEEVNPMIVKLSKELKLSCIDLHTPFENKAQMFPDLIHPNNKGANLMAWIIYEALTVKKKNRQYKLSSYGKKK